MANAYVTLATNNGYCPGALVLAYSIRRAGSQAPMICMVTPEVTDEWVERLEEIFQDVIKVPTLRSNAAADKRNLELLGRPDLDITYTKFHLWRLESFEKVIYMDADTYCLQSIDELFDIELTDEEGVAACSDMGWPDCFNSGVMLTRPSPQTFERLLAFAQNGGSFDGGDQGVLNDYFPRWRRLPFGYNMTPGAVYSNAPAYQRYKDSVKVVHFAGTAKPWEYVRTPAGYVVSDKSGSAHLALLINMWWQLHDVFVSGYVPGKEVYNKQVMMWSRRATPSSAAQASRDSAHPTKRAPSENTDADEAASASRSGGWNWRGHTVYHVNYHVMDTSYKSMMQRRHAGRHAGGRPAYYASPEELARQQYLQQQRANAKGFMLPPREDDDGEAYPIRLKAHALLPWERDPDAYSQTALSSQRETPVPAQFMYADTHELRQWTSAADGTVQQQAGYTGPSSPMDIESAAQQQQQQQQQQRGDGAKPVPAFNLEADQRPIWEQAAYPQFQPAPGYPEHWTTLESPGAPASLYEQAAVPVPAASTDEQAENSRKLAPLPAKPTRPRKASNQNHSASGRSLVSAAQEAAPGSSRLAVPADFANYRVDWSQQELHGIKLAPLDRSPSLRAMTPGALQALEHAEDDAAGSEAARIAAAAHNQPAASAPSSATQNKKSAAAEQSDDDDEPRETVDANDEDGRPQIVFRSPPQQPQQPEQHQQVGAQAEMKKLSLDAQPASASGPLPLLNLKPKPTLAPLSPPAAAAESASNVANRIKMFNTISNSESKSPSPTSESPTSASGDRKWQADLKKSNQALTLLSQAFQEATSRRSPSPVNLRIAEDFATPLASGSASPTAQPAIFAAEPATKSAEPALKNAEPASQSVSASPHSMSASPQTTSASPQSVSASPQSHASSHDASDAEYTTETDKLGVEKTSMPASKARSFFSRLSLRKKSVDGAKAGKDKDKTKEDEKKSAKTVRLSAR